MPHSMRFRLKTSALAIAMLGLPLAVQAAGIGRLTVLSALGQPLRAEIELSASKDELNSLTAKVASPDQFRQQGVDYAGALANVRLSVEKRSNGQPYVRMTSDKPLNEPFLDVLVELNWASGRLLREYTFLLDPPDLPRRAAETPVNVPETTIAKPTTTAPVGPAIVESIPAPAAPAKAETTKGKKPAVKVKEEPAPSDAQEQAAKDEITKSETAKKEAGTRKVAKGDTLGKIAKETAPAGVSLDQMLVALFNQNQDAFDGGNMNRLRTGKILSIPDQETASAVDPSAARKTIAVQAQNFNAYRKTLAEAAASGQPSGEPITQSASGKIAPKVEDKAPPAPAGKDKLEVSRTESGKGAAAAKLSEEDKIAREKALKEAQSRVAELEKNVAELKKLSEMKSQALADMQKQAQAAKNAPPPPPPAPPKPEVKPAEPPKVAEAPKPEAKPVEPPAPPAPPVEAAKPADAAPPAPPAAPADNAPPPKKKVVIPEPEPEPSFMEENGPLVFGGLGIVALLGGLLGYRAWKKKRDAQADVESPSQFSEALSASSVFSNAGGQSIDTSNVSMDFSQSGAAAGDTAAAGVDPVAEAEVYMAYGRDAQAEEILQEALKAEPTREAVHLKLLELYAARKTPKPFEEVARELHKLTNGSGPNWDKAVALGRSIDPTNSLYGGSPAAAAEPEPADAGFGTSTVIMPPGELAKMAAMSAAPAVAEAAAEPAAQPEEPAPALDFDLDLGAPAEASGATPAAAEPAPTVLDFDLDLGAPAAAPEPTPAAPAPEPETASPVIDFSLPEPSAVEEKSVEAPPASAPSASDLQFDLDAPAPGGKGLAETLIVAPESMAAMSPAPAGSTGLAETLMVPPESMTAMSPTPESSAPAAGNAMDFEFTLDLPKTDAPSEAASQDVSLDMPPSEPPAPTLIVEPGVDFSSINLDLDTPAASPASAPEAPATGGGIPDAEDNPEVATKLELAQAYEEMGDKEGVRELLQEVLNEGTAAQQEMARKKLAELDL